MKNLYPLILLGFLLVFGGTSAEAFEPNNGLATVTSESLLEEGPLVIEVELRTNYADGVTTKQSVYETIWAMEDFWSQYADWQLVDQEEGKMVFERNFEDISPASKQNGHFGLTEDGVLTIFDGDPADEKVIQTFFQIDVGKLESQRREQLMDGIPVESWYQFEDVIQSFSKIKSEPVQ
ncbi:regulator [Bacillus hwajinpoensis]|uniref:Regulator n=1 Tax=Guptibacillus hwajinpoensis TaxID=208199 RepID=A0A845EWK3_9BACL|nr:BofC C-terminal domain-containing protein [Pseudalkalibacillus hwajinpoensis]MYL62922.1 regulator [Pseudalkalibacillus hwajinpoensis]